MDLRLPLAMVLLLLSCAPRPSPTPVAAAAAIRPLPDLPMLPVPAGPFTYGCDPLRDPLCETDEAPARVVTLSLFEIDATEVTQGHYEACVSAGACTRPYNGPTPWEGETCQKRYEPGARADRPVVCVNWDQAAAYCAFRGKRLPTETEWEKAARGSDGRTFPWGNDPATCQRAAIQQCGDVPAGSRPAGKSPCGALDMSGGAGEWTASQYESGGDFKVIRGVEFNATHLDVWDWRPANRFALAPQRISYRVGFRCARSP